MSAVGRISTMLLRQPFANLGRLATRGYAAEAQMKFTFACPASVFYHDAHVRQVDVPSFSGSFGILPQHVPTVAALKPGVVTIYEQEGATKKIFVSSGTVSVNEDGSVQVLAEEAMPIEDLDAQLARQELADAQREAATGDEVSRIEAQIKVEAAEAVVRAAESGL